MLPAAVPAYAALVPWLGAAAYLVVAAAIWLEIGRAAPRPPRHP